MTCLRAEKSLLGSRWYCTPFWGQMPQKPIFVAEIGLLKLNAQNIQTFILSKPLQWFRPNFAQWYRPPNTVKTGHPKLRSTSPRWWTVAILKIIDKSISLSNHITDFDDLHVVWRVSVQGWAYGVTLYCKERTKTLRTFNFLIYFVLYRYRCVCNNRNAVQGSGFQSNFRNNLWHIGRRMHRALVDSCPPTFYCERLC